MDHRILLFSLVFPACTAGASGSKDDTAAGGDDTGAGTAATIELTGRFAVYGAWTVLGGAELCWVASNTTDLCTVADDAGDFALEVPAGGAGALTIVHPDIAPAAWALTLGDEDLALPGMGFDSPQAVEAFYAAIGKEPAAGSTLVNAFVPGGTTGLAGVTGTLTPAADGPWYFSSSGDLDLDATATSSAGAIFWAGVSTTAGAVTATLTGPDGQDCASDAQTGLPAGPMTPIEGHSLFFTRSCD